MKHLTAADRGRIEVLLTLKHSSTEIGRLLGRHKSTITRELQKGTNHVGAYSAEYAELVSGAAAPLVQHPKTYKIR